MSDELLSTKEFAAERRLSRSYLNQLRCRGEGPAYLKIGGKVMYRRSDIDAWFASCVRTSTSDKGGRKARAA